MSPRDWPARIEDILGAIEYFRIDVAVLWQTVNQNLAPPVPLLRSLLDQESH